MSRYLQKISLRPFSNTEIWVGWELEGHSGPIEGLLPADRMTSRELAQYGVSEFQRIPAAYVESRDLVLK